MCDLEEKKIKKFSKRCFCIKYDKINLDLVFGQINRIISLKWIKVDWKKYPAAFIPFPSKEIKNASPIPISKCLREVLTKL